MIDERRMNETEEQQADEEILALVQGLGLERAPASLRRRLKRIPREEKRRERQWSWQPPRWAMVPALAAVPLLVLGLVLMQPGQPSRAEIEQARMDLAVAFAYIDKAGLRTGHEIQNVLGGELNHSVTDNLSRHIPFTEQSRKEENS